MVSFIGRSGHFVLFSQDDQAVIVDSRVSVVTAFGPLKELESAKDWDSGDYSETDHAMAVTAFSSEEGPSPEATGRLYTVPRGVQMAAKRALESLSVGSFPKGAVRVAEELAAGGQIDFNKLVHVNSYFERHAQDAESGALVATASGPSKARISWDLHGGDAARKWTKNIVSREAVVASGSMFELDLKEILSNAEAGPEFIARLDANGSGIDRLYRVDIDQRTYVWEDDAWDDLGQAGWDVWKYDRYLDGNDEVGEKVHVLIDPESAIYIAANLKYGNVYVEDINVRESKLAKEAAPDIDLELIDSVLTATGGTPGDGIYTEEERSENAGKQVRDGSGKFAKQGGRVMVNGVPGATGTISRVNPADGTVEVALDGGGVQTVLGKQVETVDSTAGRPGMPGELPRVDFSGILGEPRTPINRVKGQIPGTLPAITREDLHAIINNFPAWVKSQREKFSALGEAPRVGVQPKNSLDTGEYGKKLKEETGQDYTTDAYDHPLLNKWLNKKNTAGQYANRLWYQPITAAGEESGATVITPENSDVQPVYMAVVSPDDPRAVFKLISLVPATTKALSPTVYSREDGQWVRDEQTLNDLRSATPPPVVPLDSDNLNDVLIQVDGSQAENDEETQQEDAEALNAPIPDSSALPPGAPAVEDVVVASAIDDLDFNLMVMWGPRQDIMQQALVAAGGADRNRGGAEKLRRYWTIGPGGAKIAWGTPGDWTRCVRQLGKYLGPRAKGYCALRHKEMTGMWTGDKEHVQAFSANTVAPMLSDDLIEPTESVVASAVLRARSAIAKNRVITASGVSVASPFDVIYEDKDEALTAITAAAWDTRDVGGAFWIPLALPEGIESGDGRLIEPGVAEIRTLPISLLWQFKTASGHDGSVVVGRIERLHRVPGGIGAGYGHFDTGSWGREAERMVRNGMLRFVSADMDKFGAVRERPDEAQNEGTDSRDVIESDKVTVKKTRVMAVTIVAKPAFQEATIQIVPDEPLVEDEVFPDGLFMEEPDPIDMPAILAAGYIAEAVPVVPPREWFNNPKLSGPTPLTVDDNGHVYGHIAAWSSGHINPRLAGINPPRSRTNYSYFHTGVIRTSDGKDIPVGQLTLSGGHAGLEFSAQEAVKHYDDTGSAVADVHAGEDQFGIWVSGSLRPGVTPEQVRAFRASAPSGDWRPIRGNLELVAVCQVNVPGFPIARAFVASGEMTALVAAGAAPLMRMKSDPIAELSARLEAVEQFSAHELSARASQLKDRMAPAIEKRDTELQQRAEAVFATMETFGYVPKKVREKQKKDKSLTASVESMRSRVAEFAASVDQDELNRLRQERGAVETPKAPTAEEARPKYKPGFQPRDYNGQFRDVLARLKEDLGTSGNQGVVDKIKETNAKAQTGDYVTAVKGALDLKDVLDRLDSGALDAKSIANVRESAKHLGTVIANLPLPFDNQAAKVRFSDLPPALRDLIEEFVERVQNKIGMKDAAPAVAKVKSFMSGSDLFSQGDISTEMSKMLRLLT